MQLNIFSLGNYISGHQLVCQSSSKEIALKAFTKETFHNRHSHKCFKLVNKVAMCTDVHWSCHFDIHLQCNILRYTSLRLKFWNTGVNPTSNSISDSVVTT